MQKAYVLHYRGYRETSLLVELFAEQAGRISVIVRGAKRPKSLLKGLLQPFNPMMVTWRGKGDLPTLLTAESDYQPIQLHKQRLFCGFYLNELLMRLLHKHDPCMPLFHLYEKTLIGLSDEHLSEQILLRTFERSLLVELGYALNFYYEADSHETIRAGESYYYLPEKGFCLLETAKISHSLSTHVFKGESLIAIAENQYETKAVLLDAKRLMRLAIKTLLGDKPLKSKELFW